MTRYALAAALLAASLAPAVAGPCTQRIAEVEKNISAKHEGGGPALAPAPQGGAATSGPATSPAASGASSTPGTQAAAPKADNDAMQLVQRAKELDKGGKEQECMTTIGSAEKATPVAPK